MEAPECSTRPLSESTDRLGAAGMKETHLVTGAFGYSGSYIARELLRARHSVCTLTRSPDRENEFGDSVRVFPLDFGDRSETTGASGPAVVWYVGCGPAGLVCPRYRPYP